MKYLVILACIALASASSVKTKDEKKSESSEVTTQAPPQGWLNPWFYSGPEGRYIQKPFFQSWVPPYPFWAAYPQAQPVYPQAQAAYYQQQPQFNPYVQYQGYPVFAQQGLEGQQPAQNPWLIKNFWANQPWAQQQENVQEPAAQQNVPFWYKPWGWNPNPNIA
ncbi:uncharacterized protein LOC126736756 [Anthonomus grandis grandis]|uniref:uncharacterized protein LOC126736756 n=1 Tax=Anthonomus grandis grandis TaxID=2921223 RepID=UPI0021653CCF|nr:uncharacterized protein LOC126736756 [Anthonomus grandis grandis]